MILCNMCKKFTPFSNLNNEEFIITVQGKKLPFTSKRRRHSSDKNKFFEKINNINRLQIIDESVKSYTTPQEIKSQIQNDINLSLLNLNISSLGYPINEFQDLLSTCEIDFQVIGITESRLKAHKKGLIDITIPGYNFEHCPTEGNCGGTLIYIKDNLSYKNRNATAMGLEPTTT